MTRKSAAAFLMDRLRMRESWVIFFILGIIMMNYPFIQVFNKETTIAGMPLLYLYFNAGWLVSIVVIYLFRRAGTPAAPRDDESGHR